MAASDFYIVWFQYTRERAALQPDFAHLSKKQRHPIRYWLRSTQRIADRMPPYLKTDKCVNVPYKDCRGRCASETTSTKRAAASAVSYSLSSFLPFQNANRVCVLVSRARRRTLQIFSAPTPPSQTMAGSFGTKTLIGIWCGVAVCPSTEQIRDGGF